MAKELLEDALDRIAGKVNNEDDAKLLRKLASVFTSWNVQDIGDLVDSLRLAANCD